MAYERIPANPSAKFDSDHSLESAHGEAAGRLTRPDHLPGAVDADNVIDEVIVVAVLEIQPDIDHGVL